MKAHWWKRLLCRVLGHKHFGPPRFKAYYGYGEDFYYFCLRCEATWESTHYRRYK